VITPIAVRSMPMLRDAASGLSGTDSTVAPEVCDRLTRSNAGTIRGTGFGKFNN
jgi:hypothetical protein